MSGGIDSTALEAIWDGDLGDTITPYTATQGTADAYGEKSDTWAAGTAVKGRIHIIKANEILSEAGNLVPGDAIALLKNASTIAINQRVLHNSIYYTVIGVVARKTHRELSLKRLP